MMEGVMQVSERPVREIMIPRAQMDVIDISEPRKNSSPFVIETAHSRFPVTDGEKTTSSASCWAKDLLRYYAGEEFNVRDMLASGGVRAGIETAERAAARLPLNRNHIALVADEYGGVSAW